MELNPLQIQDYPYRTCVNAEPRWTHPMGQHLDQRLVEWYWRPWSLIDSAAYGIHGEVCFKRTRDQLLFELTCGDYVVCRSPQS